MSREMQKAMAAHLPKGTLIDISDHTLKYLSSGTKECATCGEIVSPWQLKIITRCPICYKRERRE